LPIVELPDGRRVEFPDDGQWDGPKIKSYLSKKIPDIERQAQAKWGGKPYQSPFEGIANAIYNAPGQLTSGLIEGNLQEWGESGAGRLDNLSANADAIIAEYGERIPPEFTETGRLMGIGDPAALWNRFRDPQQREAVVREMGDAYAKTSLGAQLRIAEQKGGEKPVDLPEGSFENYAAQAISSVVQMAPALGASVLTRSPLPAITMMAAQSNGEAYARVREKLPPGEAQKYAAAFSLAETLPGTIPLGVLLKSGKGFWTRMGQTVATESATEMLTAGIQAAIDQGFLEPDMEWDEAWRRIKDAGIVGAMAAPVMSAGAHVAGAGVDRAGSAAADVSRQVLSGVQGSVDRAHLALETMAATRGADMQTKLDAWLDQQQRMREPASAPAPDVQAPALPDLPTSQPSADGMSVVDRIISIESAGRADAQNPRSSAGGLGQFIDSTWLATVKQHGGERVAGMSDADILRMKKDTSPEGIAFHREMLEAFTNDNAAALLNSGIEATPGNIYLAHFLGVGGARTVMSAGDGAALRDVMTAKQIQANPFLKDWTVGQLKAWAANKMGSAAPFEVRSGGAATAGGGTQPGEAAPSSPPPIGNLPPAEVADGVSQSGGVATPDVVQTPAVELRRVTPDGSIEVQTRPEIVDAATLTAASGDLQPRDRTRKASDAQIEDIALRLDPARLMPSPETHNGAPIIGPDGVVESGNGRVKALMRAAEAYPERFDAYRQALRAAGYDVPDTGVPILVSRRTSEMTPEQRVAFVNASNTDTIARMSATEMAGVDRRAMTPSTLSKYAGGDVASAGNRGFVSAFLGNLTQSERSSLVGADGALNADGLRRIQNALMAAAYGDADVVERVAEATDDNARSITGAMQDVAAAWASMRQKMAEGEIDRALDLTPHLTGALRLISRARQTAAENNGNVANEIDKALKQDDMFGGSVPVEVEGLVRAFYNPGFRSAKSRDRIAEYLRAIVSETEAAGQPNMFGDAASASQSDVIEGANRKTAREEGKTGDIFGAERGKTDGSAEKRPAAPARDNGSRRTEGREVERGSQPKRGSAAPARRDEGWAVTESGRPVGVEPKADTYSAEPAQRNNTDLDRGDRGDPTMGERPNGARPVTPDEFAAASTLNRGPAPAYVPLHSMATPQRPQSGTIQVTGKTLTLPDETDYVRRDIARRALVQMVGSRVYTGKIKGKRKLGFYRSRNSEIRIRKYDDLEVLGHEAAHFLDFDQRYQARFTRFRQQHAAELDRLSYTTDPQLINIEGFAEFVRLWATNYPAAQRLAPRAVVAFEKELRAAKLFRAMTRFQQRAHEWYFQGPLAQLRGKSGETESFVDDLRDFAASSPIDNARQEAIDRLHGFKVVERSITGTVGSAETSPYKLAQLANGAESVHEAVIMDGTPRIAADGSLEFSGHGLSKALFPVAKKGWKHFSMFLEYAKARRAAELMEQGRENLFTKQEIAAGLDLAKKYPEFEPTFAAYQAFNSRMLDWFVEMDLITPDQRQAFADRNADYVPFHRIIQRAADGKRQQGVASIGQTLRGGDRNTREIADNIVEGLFSNVRAAMLARAKSNLFKMIEGHQEGSQFAVRLGPDSKPVQVAYDQLKAKFASVILELGFPVSQGGTVTQPQFPASTDVVDLDNMDLVFKRFPQLTQFWLHNQAPTTVESHVEPAIVDGELRWYETNNPLLIRTLTGLAGTPTPTWARPLTAVRNMQTRLITSLPQFQIPNIFRDTLSAASLTQSKFTPFVDSARGFGKFVSNSPEFKRFRLNGGLFSSRVQAMTSDSRKRVALDVPAASAFDHLQRSLAKWDATISAVENSTRLGQFTRAIDAGLNPMEAAWQGREISTDFAKAPRSAWWTMLLRITPFANAALQGNDNLVEKLTAKDGKITPKGAISRLALMSMTRFGGMLAMFSLVLAVLNQDDERYQGLTPDEKARFWHIWVPGRDEAITIPKPYGVGFLFADLPTALIDYVWKRDGEAAAKNLAYSLMQTFWFMDLPGFAAPTAEVMLNKKFTGAPIVPQNLQEAPAPQQFADSTPSVYRALGEALGVSPVVAEHYAKGYFGYLEQFMADGTEQLLWDEKRWGPRPFARSPMDYFTGRFSQGKVTYRTKWTEGYYELRERARGMAAARSWQIKNTVRDEAGLTKLVNDPVNQALLTVNKLFGKIDAQFKGSDAILRAIKYDPGLSKDEKEAQIEKFYADKNEVLKRTYLDAKRIITDAEKRVKK
jgi:hypothetical protein